MTRRYLKTMDTNGVVEELARVIEGERRLFFICKRGNSLPPWDEFQKELNDSIRNDEAHEWDDGGVWWLECLTHGRLWKLLHTFSPFTIGEFEVANAREVATAIIANDEYVPLFLKLGLGESHGRPLAVHDTQHELTRFCYLRAELPLLCTLPPAPAVDTVSGASMPAHQLGGQSRINNSDRLVQEAKRLYEAGSYKSKRAASFELVGPMREFAKANKLAPSNSAETIYKYLRK